MISKSGTELDQARFSSRVTFWYIETLELQSSNLDWYQDIKKSNISMVTPNYGGIPVSLLEESLLISDLKEETQWEEEEDIEQEEKEEDDDEEE